MKISWFDLMPYRLLPPDFEEKYRSVWVDVPSHLFDPVRAHRLYNEYLDELEYAGQVGFDGICVNEHHNNAYGIMPSPNLMAAMPSRPSSRTAGSAPSTPSATFSPWSAPTSSPISPPISWQRRGGSRTALSDRPS